MERKAPQPMKTRAPAFLKPVNLAYGNKAKRQVCLIYDLRLDVKMLRKLEPTFPAVEML